MIRICTGFPPEWPPEMRERIVAAFAQHWPASIELVADELSGGGDLDRHRLIIPAAVADEMDDGDLLAWIDPNVETASAVPSYVIPQLICDADLCFISRSSGSLDPGFWAVRLSSPVRSFLIELALAAGKSEAAAGVLADKLDRSGLKVRDLTPGKAGDIWEFGPLARYTDRLQMPE